MYVLEQILAKSVGRFNGLGKEVAVVVMCVEICQQGEPISFDIGCLAAEKRDILGTIPVLFDKDP